MSERLTMPRDEPGRLYLRHELPLPSCCPVSGNPQPGSRIRISYRPALPGCSHQRCNNCLRYATRWADQVAQDIRTRQAIAIQGSFDL